MCPSGGASPVRGAETVLDLHHHCSMVAAKRVCPAREPRATSTVQPGRDSVPGSVRRVARRVPQGVVGIEVTDNDGVVVAWEQVRVVFCCGPVFCCRDVPARSHRPSRCRGGRAHPGCYQSSRTRPRCERWPGPASGHTQPRGERCRWSRSRIPDETTRCDPMTAASSPTEGSRTDRFAERAGSPPTRRLSTDAIGRLEGQSHSPAREGDPFQGAGYFVISKALVTLARRVRNLLWDVLSASVTVMTGT